MKPLFFGLAMAALATTGFAIANNSSRPSLTPSQLESLEALSVGEYVPDYCCVEEPGSICFNGEFALADSKEAECR